MEMPRGVAAWRAIATADVTTAQAKPKMNPRSVHFQALFTSERASGNWIKLGQVVTTHL
jgi:hypothetical protein